MKRQKGYMSDGAVVFLLIAGVIALFAVVMGLALYADASACHKRASMMRLSSDWGFLQGCMVDTGDRWAPIEYIRIVDGKIAIQGDGE